MPITTLAEVQDQIEKFWSPLFTKTLRESLLMGSLVNRDYEGQIKELGDQVRVSQIVDATGELRTVGGTGSDDANAFETESLQTVKVDIKADKRAVAAYEFAELVELQSQIGAEKSAIRESLMFAVEKQINTYLYSLVSPSTSSPDHTIGSVADFNATQLLNCRKLAAQAKWRKDKGWFALLDPSYYNDILNATTMTSSDYVGDDQPVVGGQVAKQRFGFNILEDNSRPEDTAVLFHPDFMHLVMQSQARFKVSDQHANKKFGYIVSVDLIFGAKLGIDGAKKHIKVTASA